MKGVSLTIVFGFFRCDTWLQIFPKWLQNLWTRSHTDSAHQENLQTLYPVPSIDNIFVFVKYMQ